MVGLLHHCTQDNGSKLRIYAIAIWDPCTVDETHGEGLRLSSRRLEPRVLKSSLRSGLLILCALTLPYWHTKRSTFGTTESNSSIEPLGKKLQYTALTFCGSSAAWMAVESPALDEHRVRSSTPLLSVPFPPAGVAPALPAPVECD
eukprot:COSAG02_NODE_42_length_46522_cov_109.704478_26_plen_146_part_00